MGVPLYSLFLLVDMYITIFVYLIYGRLDITNMRPYVVHNLLHNHSTLYHSVDLPSLNSAPAALSSVARCPVVRQPTHSRM